MGEGHFCALRLNGVDVPSSNSAYIKNAVTTFSKLEKSRIVEPWVFWDCSSKYTGDCKAGVENLESFLAKSFSTRNIFVYTNKQQKEVFPHAHYAYHVYKQIFHIFSLLRLFWEQSIGKMSLTCLLFLVTLLYFQRIRKSRN